MYNPFNGETMKKVLDNLEYWKNKYNRDYFIIYMNPAEQETLENSLSVNKINSKRAYNVYQG